MVMFKMWFIGYRFTRRDTQDCLFRDYLDSMTSNPESDYEGCKQWCADNTDCGGITAMGDNCNFKGLACKDNVFDYWSLLFLKEVI